MSLVQRLYELQRLDLELDSRRARLNQIDTLLGDNQTRQAAREQLVAARRALLEVQNQVKSDEAEIASLQEKIAKEEGKLYSGRIGNPKELQSLQEEVESLKRHRAAQEDVLLTHLLIQDERQSAFEQAQTHWNATEVAWKKEQADLMEERSRLEDQVSALQGERKRLAAAIDPVDLTEYEMLRRRSQAGPRPGHAISLIENGVCGICREVLPAAILSRARSGQALIPCPQCGRILYLAR